MIRRFHLLLLLLLASCALLPAADSEPVRLKLRSRVEAFKGSGQWQEATLEYRVPASRTAIILCDMWDKHWCRGATERAGQLAPGMNPLLNAARRRGVLVIHAPSETMGFYQDYPQRKAILGLAKAEPPAPLALADPSLPIDDKSGGCDTHDSFFKAWTRQNAAIQIDPRDLISDNGGEVYSALKLRGIDTLFVAGVHTNMCVLNRSFAIKQMTKWGIRCILIRDLTDAMYDPKDRPFVSHQEGTQLVIEHIEKHWAPSILSSQLLDALK
jgi:nicotinamidase-related amidase